MERISCFIDGFNLYHAIARLREPHLKWVDLWRLAERYVRPRSQRLDAVHYFSALAEWLPEACDRHAAFATADDR